MAFAFCAMLCIDRKSTAVKAVIGAVSSVGFVIADPISNQCGLSTICNTNVNHKMNYDDKTLFVRIPQ